MDYDSLLQDRWDRLMLRFFEDQTNESTGSSLPSISGDDDIQFDLEIEESSNADNESSNEYTLMDSQNQSTTTQNVPIDQGEDQATIEEVSDQENQQEEVVYKHLIIYLSSLYQVDICTICLEDLVDNVISLNCCLHSFHAVCIYVWLYRESSCPLCRQTI